MNIQSLVKRYFYIHDIIKQGDLPESAIDNLWYALDDIQAEIRDMPCANLNEMAAKMRLAESLTTDWNVASDAASKFMGQVRTQFAAMHVAVPQQPAQQQQAPQPWLN